MLMGRVDVLERLVPFVGACLGACCGIRHEDRHLAWAFACRDAYTRLVVVVDRDGRLGRRQGDLEENVDQDATGRRGCHLRILS